MIGEDNMLFLTAVAKNTENGMPDTNAEFVL